MIDFKRFQANFCPNLTCFIPWPIQNTFCLAIDYYFMTNSTTCIHSHSFTINKLFPDVSVTPVYSHSNSFRMLIETSFVFNYADNWIFFYSKPCFLKKCPKKKRLRAFFAELCIQKWLFPTELHVIEWIKTVFALICRKLILTLINIQTISCCSKYRIVWKPLS